MAGNGDEAGRTGPQGRGWSADCMAMMRGMVDDAILAASTKRPSAGDVAAADRLARAVVNIARAVKAAEAPDAMRHSEADTENPEDEMSDDREYTPERLAEMREELLSRRASLHDIIERKRAARDAYWAAVGTAAEGGADAGGPSGRWPMRSRPRIPTV